MYSLVKARAQAQANTPRQGTKGQRKEHPGGENIIVTTYGIFNHYAVLIEMFGVTLPPILMSIHHNDLVCCFTFADGIVSFIRFQVL